MKLFSFFIFLFLFLGLVSMIFLSGCTTIKCENFCVNQKHISCTGYFVVSGEHPNCQCKYICDNNSSSNQNLS